MQKRLIRKLDLEIFLSQIKPHPSPKPNLEQYTIPADLAATLLRIAAYTNNDIVGKTVLDLGCGTGRLALGAAFLGAEQVLGVDIDKSAIKIACEDSVAAGFKEKVQWIAGDVDAVSGEFDTVLQNPPFGVQKRGADRKFLKKALETGKTIYSLHKNVEQNVDFIKKLKISKNCVVPVGPSPFLRQFIEKHNGKIKSVFAMVMTIPYMFDFHAKRKHEFVVDLFVVERKQLCAR